MITLFDKYKKSKFNVGDIVVTDYLHDNELGIYKISSIQYHSNIGCVYIVFDIINNKKIDGWYLESDLRLANQSEIDEAEVLKNLKIYNL